MAARALPFVLFAALGTAGAFAVTGASDPPAQTITVTRTETVRQTVRKLQSFQGRTAKWWAKRTWYWKRRTKSLKRTLLADQQVQEAINLACRIYGNCPTLWRKARCESHLFPGAFNSSSSASGLFQFLPSTWRTTPFGVFSIFSPYANALAAGWMHQAGRGGEWVCG